MYLWSILNNWKGYVYDYCWCIQGIYINIQMCLCTSTWFFETYIFFYVPKVYCSGYSMNALYCKLHTLWTRNYNTLISTRNRYSVAKFLKTKTLFYTCLIWIFMTVICYGFFLNIIFQAKLRLYLWTRD